MKNRHCQDNRQQAKRKGFSLVEAAVLLGLISVFFIPVARLTGGAGQTSTIGKTATDATRNRMRETVAANTLMEQALVGNMQNPNINLATLDPNNPFNTGVQQFTNYNRRVLYDWTLLNQSFAVDANGNLQRDNQGNLVPLVNGNRLASATLRIFPDGSTGTQPSLVLPTTIANRRASANAQSPASVGVLLVLDTSGSMAWAKGNFLLPNTTEPSEPNPLLVASPFLTYRHAGNNALDLTKNEELDVVSVMQADSAATPFDDSYIPGISTQPNLAKVKLKSGCANNPQNANYFIAEAKDPAAPSRPSPWGNELWNLNRYVQDLCSITPSMSVSDWQTIVDRDLSRVEAARSAMFVFINRIESNPFLRQMAKLGFESYGTSGPSTSFANRIQLHSALQSSQNGRYAQLREWTSYINRLQSDGTVRVQVYGKTPTLAALRTAAQTLYNDTSLTDRIIILMTDGSPTDDTGGQINQMMTDLGAGTAAGANGRRVTVFSVGIIGADKAKLDEWANKNRAAGADGESFFASNVVETMSVLDRVADATIRVALNANTCRYNVSSTSTPCPPSS
jgi:competence protein ComGC